MENIQNTNQKMQLQLWANEKASCEYIDGKYYLVEDGKRYAIRAYSETKFGKYYLVDNGRRYYIN